MLSWIPWLIACVSLVGCLILWFRDVRRIMLERQSTVESAAEQLNFWRRKASQTIDDPDAAAVLKRSEDIYGQAVNIYNKSMRKPWVCLPARLMGFRSIPYR